MKKTAYFVLFPALIFSTVVFAATQTTVSPQETESTVPELTAFHEIIYPIWHTAYPQKDYAALRSYAPEVKGAAEKIYAAKLPAILHEKQAKWDQALAELRKTVDEYLTAAAGSDGLALLNAAEALHSQYEMMVRTIRPVLKEVDDFHRLLYVVYHQYLPDKAYEKIKGVSEEMMLGAEAITKATLPNRLEAKSQAFTTAASELYEAAKSLAETSKSGSGEKIAAAVETVHTKYQSLAGIFD
jgi:hypothetical protein